MSFQHQPWQQGPGNLLPPGGGVDQKPRVVPWTAGDVFAIVGLVIAVFVFLSIAVGALLKLLSFINIDGNLEGLAGSPLANSIFWLLQWVITLGIAFAYFKLRGYRINLTQLGFRRTGVGQAALLIFGILVGSFAFQAIYVTYITEPQQEPVTGIFGTSFISFILAMLIVAVLTPVVEEMFFRGIIHQGLEQRLGFLPGAVISASIFMVAHVDPTVFLPIFVLGIGFAALMSQTKSLWPSIVAHALWNSMGVIAEFLSQ